MFYKLGGDALRNASLVIFSTNWQKSIFEKAYSLDSKKSRLVENYCGKREEAIEPENRVFVAGTRDLVWKNIDTLKKAFKSAQTKVVSTGFEPIEFDTTKAVYDNFQERMRRSYCVILASIGDISPNMIFDAIRLGIPFILTKENGITDRVKDCAVFIDPTDEKDIADKIKWISDPKNRALQAEKIKKFDWVHTWEDIGNEIISLYAKL